MARHLVETSNPRDPFHFRGDIVSQYLLMSSSIDFFVLLKKIWLIDGFRTKASQNGSFLVMNYKFFNYVQIDNAFYLNNIKKYHF